MDTIITTIKGVYVVGAPKQLSPVLLLADDSSDRIMPIFVGHAEAMSIHFALQNEVAPRPMTHDLIISMLNELGSDVEHVLIDDLDEGTFYARLVISVQNSVKELDARPSDCIVLAVKAGSPVYVRKDLFDLIAVDSSEFEGVDNITEYLP